MPTFNRTIFLRSHFELRKISHERFAAGMQRRMSKLNLYLYLKHIIQVYYFMR